MQELITFAKEHVTEFSYGITVVLLTFLFLKWGIINPNRRVKVWTNIIIGIILGALWYSFTTVDLPIMILVFTSTVAFYDWIIKWLMRKMKITYHNDKGLL